VEDYLLATNDKILQQLWNPPMEFEWFIFEIARAAAVEIIRVGKNPLLRFAV
jgi:hypothetical protein